MDTITTVKETISQLLKTMAVEAEEIRVEEDAIGIIRVDITVSEREAPLLIGSYGQTLNALQVILKSLLWRKDFEQKLSVQVDVNQYRRKQEDRMIGIAKEKAEAVRATGMVQSMPPMSPYMRRVIHLHMANDEQFADLQTMSVGEGPARRLQIAKKDGGMADLEMA